MHHHITDKFFAEEFRKMGVEQEASEWRTVGGAACDDSSKSGARPANAECKRSNQNGPRDTPSQCIGNRCTVGARQSSKSTKEQNRSAVQELNSDRQKLPRHWHIASSEQGLMGLLYTDAAHVIIDHVDELNRSISSRNIGSRD
mmetsp:Transcript_84280/g.225275  ORF Transcript_84280/g.225275 Transcript_84280/m.225275 type:complete len:144 (-) Transcript_84280:138-569(-)|eukprot:CAMPEP_0113662388 /NCGR_PEP_ID=MMETSP0038_2-20120614/542_1 /TAXON_ID=2898 /ORGANISM="Cryptomonas paramecium" /LENGTH=143 /DNA_ID=CAMNT_0000577265 /DNA_START=48 /DNA_END=479 /DNA_ORIENTATION=- /assembly_acc=CAM_ASM_000170